MRVTGLPFHLGHAFLSFSKRVSRWHICCISLNSNKTTMSKCIEALSVALQHPAVAADQRNICSILQVCKAWRTAVQQSDARLTDISLRHRMPFYPGVAASDFATKLAQFAHWTYLHAGVVRSIYLDSQSQPGRETDNVKQHAQTVLALSLRAAGAAHQVSFSPGCSSSTAADGGPHAKAAATSQALRLQSFACCSNLASSLVLSALPAAALTELCLYAEDVQLFGAVGRLSNLKSLDLHSCMRGTILDEGYFGSINKLCALTRLDMSPVQDASRLALLPQQLKKLTLRVDSSWAFPDELAPAVLLLTHLTHLQQLDLSGCCVAEGSALPQQLKELTLRVPSTAVVTTLNIPSLQHLQRLTVIGTYDGAQELLLLRQLQQLQHLELHYHYNVDTAAAARAWPHLSHLVVLHVQIFAMPTEMAKVLGALSGLTQLTDLGLECELDQVYNEDLSDDEIDTATEQCRHVCRTLQKLTKLKNLSISLQGWCIVLHDDILHLSGLTGLTALSVDVDHFFDNTMMIAVLLQLSGLQSLSLFNLENAYALPVIGKLQGLTRLSLPCLSETAQIEGLRHLTGLRKLGKLVGFVECGDEVLKQFWPELNAS